jgi:hypothetical protein
VGRLLVSTEVSGGSPEDPIFVSVRVAAQRLGLTTYEVYRLVKAGELAHRSREGKQGEPIHIYAADIPRWAAEQVEKAS